MDGELADLVAAQNRLHYIDPDRFADGPFPLASIPTSAAIAEGGRHALI